MHSLAGNYPDHDVSTSSLVLFSENSNSWRWVGLGEHGDLG